MMLVATFPTSGNAQSDPLIAQCLTAGETASTCECASNKIREKYGDSDYAAFGRVVQGYMAGMAQDLGRAASWDKALTAEGVSGESLKDWGNTQLAAITNCTLEQK
jgi:hypothetical protein